jgi:hypothetical protein
MPAAELLAAEVLGASASTLAALDGDFFPPVRYSPFWLLLVVLILVGIVAWVVFVLVLTRRRAVPVSVAQPLPGLTPGVREGYLASIDDVGRRYAAGAIGFSDAHHQLSALVRAFAAQARGIRAQYMTLDDLRRTPHADLAQTIEQLYPGAFSGETAGSIDDATARASELVRRWN